MTSWTLILRHCATAERTHLPRHVCLKITRHRRMWHRGAISVIGMDGLDGWYLGWVRYTYTWSILQR